MNIENVNSINNINTLNTNMSILNCLNLHIENRNIDNSFFIQYDANGKKVVPVWKTSGQNFDVKK